jgi:hypothetical protein
MEYSTISSESWRICIPPNWTEKKSSTGGPNYFEDPDGSKGVYIATWRVPDKGQTILEELESFRRVEMKSFDEMEGRKWKIVDQWASERPPIGFAGIDCLDREHDYRIVCQLIGSLPWVVRASFHDYDCKDYEASMRFFQPIIDSLELHSGAS